MLEKPEFDCNNIGDFYDCGCTKDEEDEDEDLTTNKDLPSARREADSDDALPLVEINREPFVLSSCPMIMDTLLITSHYRTTRG